jgi:hypothetical protein
MMGTDNAGALMAPVFFEAGKMKILILRDTVCGLVPVFAGSVVEASERDARILMMAGKASEFNGDTDAKPKTRTRKKQDGDDAGE